MKSKSSAKIKIDSNDKIYECAWGVTGKQFIKILGNESNEKWLAILVNGSVYDLSTPIKKNSKVKLLSWKDPEGKATFWHSAAHMLADAITKCYPNAKLTLGPSIARGFYYDVDFSNHSFSANELPKLEKEMALIVEQKNEFIRKKVTKEEALKYFKKQKNEFKQELIEELEDGNISFYQHGGFMDLCRGPHLPHTGLLKNFKLTQVSGAYWRGDQKNKQLTRIYGIAFPNKKELKIYLNQLEQAKKRDHRKLGKEMGFFHFSNNVGAGLPLWLPKGTFIREALIDFLKKEQQKIGYEFVATPHIGNKQLYITSGHYEKYGSSSFQPIKSPHIGEEFLLKPMNCPHHCEIYKAQPHSYRELPIRLAEFGTVYRYEKKGELHGTTRTRGFTQDDAHIFCLPSQLEEEIKNTIDLIIHLFKCFDFKNYSVQCSTRDPRKKEDYLGDVSEWEHAELVIKKCVSSKKIPSKTVEGEAAFYGPKLDFIAQDSLGREWQLSTIQLDYQLPQRFELTYVDSNNKKEQPIMIHRAIFGSLERFIAIILEHTGGKLPLWLAPTQITILPISRSHLDFAKMAARSLEKHGIRVFVDEREERISRKICDAEMQKIPYMLILGDKERDSGEFSLRKQGKINLGNFKLDKLVALLKSEGMPPH